MVKCYACNRRFSNTEFYKHAEKVHGGLEQAIFETVRYDVPRSELHDFLVRHSGDFLSTEVSIEGGKAIIKAKRLRGVARNDVYISVFDCRGTLVIGAPDEETETLGRFSVPRRLLKRCKPEQRKLIEELLWQVLEDRGGAINMSGIYHLDDEHIQLLGQYGSVRALLEVH